MPGLLAQLEAQFSGSGIAGAVSHQAGLLSSLGSAVGGLTSNTQAHSLQGTINGFHLPDALLGLGAIGGHLDLHLPTDTSGPLAPILSPLQALSGGALLHGGFSQITAIIDVVRRAFELATGRAPGGAHGFPSATPARPQPAELRATLAHLQSVLDGFGPRFDAAKVMQLLSIAGERWLGMGRRWPNIPVISHAVAALETVSAWQHRSPAELTALLTGTLHQAALLIAAPRTRVAQPFIDAGRAASGTAQTLGAAAATLSPLFDALRVKVTGDVQPSLSEVTAIEAQADALEPLADALDLARSPLGHVDELFGALDLAMLRVVRTFDPAPLPESIAQHARSLVARIPAADAAAFTPLVAQVQSIDLSALTDPLHFLREKVQQAVDGIHHGQDAVRDGLTHLLQPVDDALKAASDAIHLDDILRELHNLPQTIQNFVDQQIKPQLHGVQQAIHDAVQAVSGAADNFHPEQLVAQLREQMLKATALLRSPEVTGAFDQVKHALDSALDAVKNFKLDQPANEAIANIKKIEDKLHAIDPSSIPSAAKPLLRQAVQVVTNIDFTHQVADPLLKEAEKALEQGPALLLGTLQQLMDQLKSGIDRFRPSVVIGQPLDQPFQQLMSVLHSFHPSQLLQALADAIRSLVDRVHLVDPGALIAPLRSIYATVRQGAEALRPSHLLKPVNDEIAAAIQRVIAATHVDEVFDGIDRVLATVNSYVDTLSDAGALLSHAAAMLDAPGDIDAALDALVETTVNRLDAVDLARLGPSFAETAQAAHSVERDVIVADVAGVLQSCGGVPAQLSSTETTRLLDLVRGFPLIALRAQRQTPSRLRLVAALDRLKAVADRLDAARAPWTQAAPGMAALAPEVQPRLATYARLTRVSGGSVFAEFLAAPSSVDAIKQAVRGALRDALRGPMVLLFAAFKAISPHVAVAARGVAALLDAIHGKLAAITGEAGVTGVVHSVEQVLDLLRHLDLSPITAPLDVIYGRVEHALTLLDPQPLADALTAAANAVTGLFQLSTLIGADDIAALDHAYDTAVGRIAELAPSRVIGQVLDPVFDEALGVVKPFLDLPGTLKGMIHEAGASLEGEVVMELRRVEVAFDEMLHAIPLGDGDSPSVSGSASLTASVGG